MENIQHGWYACEPLVSVRADRLVDSVYPAIGARCMNHAGLVAQVVRREGVCRTEQVHGNIRAEALGRDDPGLMRGHPPFSTVNQSLCH